MYRHHFKLFKRSCKLWSHCVFEFGSPALNSKVCEEDLTTSEGSKVLRLKKIAKYLYLFTSLLTC